MAENSIGGLEYSYGDQPHNLVDGETSKVAA